MTEHKLFRFKITSILSSVLQAGQKQSSSRETASSISTAMGSKADSANSGVRMRMHRRALSKFTLSKIRVHAHGEKNVMAVIWNLQYRKLQLTAK